MKAKEVEVLFAIAAENISHMELYNIEYRIYTWFSLLEWMEGVPQPAENLQNGSSETSITFSERTQPAITCSKLTIETLEQGVKYVQS